MKNMSDNNLMHMPHDISFEEGFLDTSSLYSENPLKKMFHYNPIKLSNTHNAAKKKEQIRLRNNFKDKDIIINTINASYVKGRLQPTKSLGDMYLKFKEFNDISILDAEFKKQAISYEEFNGPYIDHIPEITSHILNEDDEFVVLATDGLWELLSSREVCEIINENNENKLNITDALRKAALHKAAIKANIKFEELLKLPKSLKRAVHDDISIMVVDLKNQVILN